MELQNTKSRLESMKPEGVKLRMREIRLFVEADLCDLRKFLNREPRLARAVFAKHIQKIVLTPQGGSYVAAGNWNLLGLGSYDVPGGPDRTVRTVSFCLSVAAWCQAEPPLLRACGLHTRLREKQAACV